MRIISLWQPWAQLVALGVKQYETRSWRPGGWRGRLLIHASRRWTPELRALCLQEPFRRALYGPHHPYPEVMPLGVIVATCDLGVVHHTEEIRHRLDARELAFGDFSDDRHAWELADVRRLPTPIPWRGAQGLRDAPPELVSRVLEQLATVGRAS